MSLYSADVLYIYFVIFLVIVSVALFIYYSRIISHFDCSFLYQVNLSMSVWTSYYYFVFFRYMLLYECSFPKRILYLLCTLLLYKHYSSCDYYCLFVFVGISVLYTVYLRPISPSRYQLLATKLPPCSDVHVFPIFTFHANKHATRPPLGEIGIGLSPITKSPHLI